MREGKIALKFKNGMEGKIRYEDHKMTSYDKVIVSLFLFLREIDSVTKRE